MPSNNTSVQTPLSKNPIFTHIERAPYELGHLLRALPPDFSSISAATAEDLMAAKAAQQHARNASHTVMCGLEAIGKMMFVAATNDDFDLEPNCISSLGCLIQHLAVEAQFLQETASDLDYAITHRINAKGAK